MTDKELSVFFRNLKRNQEIKRRILQKYEWALKKWCKERGHKIVPRLWVPIRGENKGKFTGDYGSGVCLICGESFGWYCPPSPTKQCEYPPRGEWCIHCGNPSERK